MAIRDKAIILLDEAREVESLAEGLGARLSLAEFHALYTSFLIDLVSQLVNLSSTSIILFTEYYLERNRWFKSVGSKAELRLLPTEEDASLHIAESLFAEGYRRLLFLTCRNPIAPMQEIQTTFHLLQLEDDVIVLGPTEDRDWYIAGIKGLHIPLLKELDLQSSDRYDQVLKAICNLDVLTFTLQPRFDVVSASGIERLRREIEMRIIESQPYPQKTRDQFFQLEKKLRP